MSSASASPCKPAPSLASRFTIHCTWWHLVYPFSEVTLWRPPTQVRAPPDTGLANFRVSKDDWLCRCLAYLWSGTIAQWWQSSLWCCYSPEWLSLGMGWCYRLFWLSHTHQPLHIDPCGGYWQLHRYLPCFVCVRSYSVWPHEYPRYYQKTNRWSLWFWCCLGYSTNPTSGNACPAKARTVGATNIEHLQENRAKLGS